MTTPTTTASAPRTTPPTDNTITTKDDHDRDAALLADYWDPTLTLFDISARHDISLRDLDAWCHRPEIAEALDLTAPMDAERSRRLVALAQSQAAGALVRATTATSPETARRAASALTRLHHQHAQHSTAPSLEQHQKQQPQQQPDHQPNQHKPTATTPAPRRSRSPKSPPAPAPAPGPTHEPTTPITPAAHLIAQAGKAPTPPRNTQPLNTDSSCTDSSLTDPRFTQPTIEEDITKGLERLQRKPKPPQRAAA